MKIKIDGIIKSANCNVGAAIRCIEDNETYLFNDSVHYPMQSVFKFPLAFAVLDRVDKGQFTLDKIISMDRNDLLPGTWSPLRDKYPGGADIPLSELISYTVSQSDNNGCDKLFQLIGGPLEVNAYIHKIGISGINITADEKAMHQDWNVQFKNWCEPSAMLGLLEKLHNGTYLSKSSNDFLMKIMTETTTGPKRIKGLLPEGTIVAHKTGSSGENEEGIAAATNDAGIITLPDGRHIIIVVFVSMSRDNEYARDEIIANISKAAWDYFVSKNKK
ncbi:MAG: class A beta-lactamase, subclass A2 [Ignavibacteria bacterium]|nr:class A beta-lactamase, subclass A2 [Ignavibacteria bacterium]